MDPLDFRTFGVSLAYALKECQSQSDMAHAASTQLKRFLSSSNFRLDCIERCLLGMSNGRKGWTNAPIYTDIAASFVVRVLYWPAHYVGDIHTHNYWTVTGVLYNEIDVVKYERTSSGELLESERYHGVAGSVGRVCPPGTHQAVNLSDTPSVTVAVFHRRHLVSRGPTEVEWVDQRNEDFYSKGIYDRALRAHIFMLDRIPDERATQLLDEAYDLAPIGLKLLATKAIARRRPKEALRRLEEVQFLARDQDFDASELARVRELMAAALEA